MILLRCVVSVVILLLLVGGPTALHARRSGTRTTREAAQLFDQGQRLYQAAQYREAIRAFTRAHELAPHRSALFNIARCHVNLGQPGQAIRYFEQALAQTRDAASQADIRRRIAQLRSRPVKVFVSSQPAGATVTIDGRAAPEPGTTPLALKLQAGEHVLLLRKRGHQLAARRIELELGQEQTLRVELQRLPEQPEPCPACPTCPGCPPPERLIDPRGLHIHFGIGPTIAFSPGVPLGAGPSVQIHGTFRRVVFGGNAAVFAGAEESIDTLSVPNIGDFDRTTVRWALAELEGGYMFPTRHAYAWATVGLGFSNEQVKFLGRDASDERVEFSTDVNAFAWSVGGGMEAMAFDWLSFGVALRLGAAHGERVDRTNLNDPERGSFFILRLSGYATFHL